MASKSTITVRILGDNKSLKNALDDSESRVGKFASGAGKVLGAAALGVAGVGAAAVTWGPQILDQGNQLEALGVKSATVFGNSLTDVEKWASGVAGSMGLTEAQLTGAAANFGDLLKPMGFTSAEAAGMSTEMLNLAGALSAWTGGQQDATQVSETLAKAMLGERDGLKSLGISISEADVQARLAANGQEDLTGAALEQAKALATQQLILEKSADAQAAWTDGSMDQLKASNEAKAGIEQVKEALIQGAVPAIQKLVPYIADLAGWLGENLPRAFDAVSRWWGRNGPWITTTVQTVFGAIRTAAEAVVSWFRENWPAIKATIDTVVSWLRDDAWPVVQAVFGFIQTEANNLIAWVKENWPDIRDTIAGVIEAVRVIVENVVKVITDLWERFGDDIMKYTQATWENIKTLIDSAIKIVRGIIDTVTALIRGDWGEVWEGIKTIVDGVWQGIKTLIDQALQVIKTTLSLAWTAIKDVAREAWEGFKGLISDAIDAAVDTIKSIPGRLLDLHLALANAGLGLGRALLDGLKDALSATAGFAGDVGAAVLNAVKNVLNTYVIDKINSALEFKIPVPLGPDISINPPDIPRLHSGGMVGSLIGPAREVPAILQTGEYVMSRADVAEAVRNGGSPTVHVYLDGQRVGGVVTKVVESNIASSIRQGVRP